MASEPDIQPIITDPEQQLRDENEALKAELAQMRRSMDLQKYRRHEVSKMLKVGFWEWDEVNRRPISFSPEMADVLGIELAQVESMFHDAEAFGGFLHPEDRQLYREKMESRAQLAPGLSRYFDYRIRIGNAEIRYIREYEQGVFDDNGRLVSTFGLVQDVTATRMTLDALTESEKRYHSLFQQMPLGVQEEDYTAVKQVVDKLRKHGVEDLQEYFLGHPQVVRKLIERTRITNVNETLVRMHKAESREQFLAAEADLDDWWDERWERYYAAEFAGLASPEKYYEAERIDTRMDDEAFETRAIVTLVRGYEHNWERVITIHEDISRRKQTETAMMEAMVQAEKANQAKSDFLSSMSHELRTPLNAILGFSQLFAYDRELSEQHLANANEINRAGKHLMSLIDQILDLSRIEAGESDISLEPVKLKRVLADSVKWAMSLAEERQIEIDFDATQFDTLLVVADSIRLKQVFLNLLTNAVKYNRPGGKVTVIRDDLGDGRLRVGVRDTGVGISSEKLKELFQPFNRLGAEFSGIEGSGIGLVISRQLVDLMQGELQIESEPDVGSTFWVELKLAPGQASLLDTQVLQIPVARAPVAAESSRILVAEDNSINQELMAAQLEVLGYSADYASNGREALEKCQRSTYELLLTDIRMPEMDGYELVRQLRQMEAGGDRRVPVIAITANAHSSDVDKCFEAGVDDVIPKPVELEDLRNALEKWIQAGPVLSLEPLEGTPQEDAGLEVIDLAVLMQSTGDKPELHRNLLQSYLDALEVEMTNLQNAFSWKNSEQIVEYSHRLKGSSRSLGVSAMAQACEQLEAAAKGGAWPEITRLMALLRQRADEAKQSIGDFMSSQVEQQARTDTASTDIDLVLLEDEPDTTQFSLKLLLVDDDYIMHRVTTVMLNDLGVSNVINAMSAPSALDILQAQGNAIDVIICDLNMPTMDGVEFIRHLARTGYEGALILTSGEDMRILKTVEKLAIEHDLQVLGVLEKPVTPAKLGELLDALDQVKEEGTMILFDAITLTELEGAINGDELDTFFQPKVEIATGQIVGVEALVRWNHPVKGLIKPDAFIPLAEDHGLIRDLTDVVCNKAMEYAARLKALDHQLNVAINLSVDSLTDLDWPEKISGVLEKYGLEPSSITFEITESRLMEHLSVALDILSRLSLKRLNLSIDDFGTGYSSMEQLQRIPFSEFKIDRAFVHGAAREASAQAILESSVLLAKKLEMKVVAEGVEDRDDWDLVARLGCDQVQGYYVAKPMPFGHLLKWLQDGDTQKKFRPDA